MPPTKDLLEFSTMSDDEVARTLKEYKVSLTVAEARKIEEILGRPPSVTEAVVWDIQGSEHCSYRSTKEHLKMLPTDGPNVILGPGEDAGIVEIARIGGKRYGLVVAHESHNHPSQVVPYEGAATGVGGIVRDVCCMGAKVIASADPLRFGDIAQSRSKWIAENVFSGIAGYGNPIGVPNIAGDCYFNSSFDDNCLVNVVALGLAREDEIIHSRAPKGAAGYDIIVVGKPTDNSGMGGAAFASLSLNKADREANKGAVQEPNPFLKRHLLAATYELFDILRERGLISKVGFKDHGAGGNVCSTVEMVTAGGYGAEINLDAVHVAMDGLHPSVVACSETQERFAWICPPDISDMILDHYNVKWALPDIAQHARASKIGKVTKGNYVLTYRGDTVLDAKPSDIVAGLRYHRSVKEPATTFSEPQLELGSDLNDVLLDVLAHENVASRRPIYEQYDKNVQGITIIESGLADAGVIAPLRDRPEVPEDEQRVGVALSVDANPRYGLVSPYWQAVNAVVEGMRNVAAVGATPWCCTDCLNYGNPEKPEQMWQFVEGVKGIRDALTGIPLKTHPESPVPCVSGNVSLYNESANRAIAPSAVIAIVGRMEDAMKAVTMQFKQAGNELFLIGRRADELGGGVLYDIFSELGAHVPKPDFARARDEIYTVIDLIDRDIAVSCHDISDGGLAVTLAEMAMGGFADGVFGFSVNVLAIADSGLPTWKKLFSETGGFVIEIPSSEVEAARGVADGYGLELISLGTVTESSRFTIADGEKEIIDVSLDAVRDAWANGLREKLR